MGIKDGTFKRYGLDITWVGNGPGSVKTGLALSAGVADIGFGDAAGVIIVNGKAKTPGFKAIFVIDTRGQDAIAVLTSSGIKSLDGLDGKVIGGINTSTSRYMLPLATNARVSYVNMGFKLRVPSLLSKKVDAVQAYLTSIPFSLKKAGLSDKDYKLFTLDINSDRISRTITVSNKWANANPGAVSNLRKAVKELLERYIKDPAKSVSYMSGPLYSNKKNKALEIERARYAINQLVLTPFALKYGINNSEALRPRIENYIDFITTSLNLPYKHSYESYFSLD
jgi:ABC-type nitrate/sulfonate/bicarbonate transport system substrate-binding protein